MATVDKDRYLTEQTVSSLREMIAEQGCHPGDRFAKEADLEAKLGVSRSVIREAVSRLRALGILESRRGLGLVVAKPNPAHLLKQVLENHLLNDEDLLDICELRCALEIGAAHLAAKRATEAQLAKLASLVEEFAQAAAGRHDRLVNDIELDFHGTILEATNSSIIISMHGVLTAFFARSADEIEDYAADEITENDVWEHRAIAEALADRNAEKARMLISGHLERLISKFKNNLTCVENTKGS